MCCYCDCVCALIVLVLLIVLVVHTIVLCRMVEAKMICGERVNRSFVIFLYYAQSKGSEKVCDGEE